MSANVNRRLQLDEVLDEFSGLSGPPDTTMLRAWTKQYPEYTRELIAFATDWVAMNAAHVAHAVTAEDVDVVVNRTMSRVQGVLDAVERSETLTDLATEIVAAGHDFDSFQRTVGIDRSMLDSLVMRLAKPATLPALLVRRVAGALNRPLDALRGYFLLPAQLAAAHKSRTRPAPTQVDFAMLVQHSQLSESEKARWLREPPDPGLQD